MKPIKILFFTLGVFFILAGTMWLTPSDGVKVGEFKFHMPTFTEMLTDDQLEYVDVSDIIGNQFDIDSFVELEFDTLFVDTIAEVIRKASYDSLVQSIHKIEMSEEYG